MLQDCGLRIAAQWLRSRWRILRPCGAFINPAFDQSDLLWRQRRPAEWHALFAAFAQNSMDDPRIFARTRRDDRAGDAALHRQRLHIEFQLSRRFGPTVALVTTRGKDGLNVAEEVHFGLRWKSLNGAGGDSGQRQRQRAISDQEQKF